MYVPGMRVLVDGVDPAFSKLMVYFGRFGFQNRAACTLLFLLTVVTDLF